MFALLLASLPATSSAYIDPGYGALFVQVLASGFLGALFLARKTLRRVLAAVFSWLGLRRAGSQGAGPSDGRPAPPEG